MQGQRPRVDQHNRPFASSTGLIDGRVIIHISASNATTTLFQYARRILTHSRFQTAKRSRLQVQCCQTMQVRSDQSELCFVRHTYLRHSPGVLSSSHLGSGGPPRSEMTCRHQMVQELRVNDIGDRVFGGIGILPPKRLAWRYFPVTSENVGWSGSRFSSSFEVSLPAFQSDRGQSI